jgi:outer membrane receptor for ferric coprogen and ferric-rhodotorulic acid
MRLRVDAAKVRTKSKQNYAGDHSPQRPLIAAAVASILATAAGMSPCVAIGAQSASATNEDTDTFDYSVPPGDLSRALNTFADISGLHLVYPSSLTAGLKTVGVTGHYTVRQALARLLEGTGLTYRFTDRRSVAVEKAPDTKGARVLGPLQVEGASAGNVTAGANGSTDATATEGTHSYTTTAVTAGGKVARDPKEIQQSISVITQQQIQDQNITDTFGALNQLTGITLVNQGTYEQIYSRGFEINSFQTDGGAALTYNYLGWQGLPDMASYDHVELLRGSDGTYVGVGNPSGTVNLVRKKPLDHNQVLLDAQAGSWNNFRGQVDVTGPLSADGHFRGRIVAAEQYSDEFYSPGNLKKSVLYGILEYDLTASTLLTLGFNYEKRDTIPDYVGIPRYTSGTSTYLPRSANLSTSWSYYHSTTQEFFGKLEQSFARDWKFTLNVSGNHQSNDFKIGYTSGLLNPVTRNGSFYGVGDANYGPRQTLVDGTVTGSFDVLGHQQQVTVGASYQHEDDSRYKSYNPSYTAYQHVDVFNWNPDAFEDPAVPAYPGFQYKKALRQQRSAYAALRTELIDGLHANGGVRYTDYTLDVDEQVLDTTTGAITREVAYGYKETHPTPFAGVTYDLTKTYALYGSWASIFQPQDVHAFTGAPLFPAATGNTSEFGVKGAWLDSKLSGSVAYYRIREINIAERSGPSPVDPECCYISGSEDSKGIDAELKGRIAPGSEMSIGYTWNINKFGANTGSVGALVTKEPRHLLKLWSMTQLPGELSKWRVGGGLNAQSLSYRQGTVYETSPAGKIVGRVPNFRMTQGSYAVASLRADYQINDRWLLGLNLNNLFDKRYFETLGFTAGSYYGDPLNFMVSVHGKF